MTAFLNGILAFTNWVWGIPMLILLAGGGIFLAFRLRFIVFIRLPFILKNTIGKSFGKENKKKKGKFSGWQAATGALASCLGSGNIVGTAMAIAFGGPGGVFWLWVAGLVSCAIKFAEVTMCMIHRHLDSRGNWEGGPSYYLSEATGRKWMGTVYAIACLFALFLAASAQIGSGVDNLVAMGAPRMVSTIILTLLCVAVVVSGMNSLMTYREKIVPIMSVLYVVGALVVILVNIDQLPGAFYSIFRYAFTGHAAVGGFAGAGVAACIRWGICRGVYSSDAGTGYTTMSHAVAEVNHPVQQGMWGVFEAFFDTIIVCSLTCFTILCTGVWQEEGVSSSAMTMTAFGSVLGTGGSLLVTVCLLLFTFTTACAQIQFACISLVKLVGEKGRIYGRWVLLAMVFVGGIVGIEALINYVDFGTFLMTVINMVGILICSGQVVKVTREYFDDPKKWETKKWPKWEQMEADYQKKCQDK